MRLQQRRLPNESPGPGSCRMSHIATTPPSRRAPPAAHACDRAPSGRTRPFVPAWSGLAADGLSYAATSGSTDAVNNCGRAWYLAPRRSRTRPSCFSAASITRTLLADSDGTAVRISSTLSALPAGAARRPSMRVRKSSWVGYRPAMKNRCRPRSRRWNSRMQSAASPSRPALPDSW